MAAGTVCRNTQIVVIGVGSLVEICGVAGSTVGWRARIAICMAFNALRRLVCARKREVCRIVVKNIIDISSGVAGKTSRIIIGVPYDPIVLIVCFRVGMTGDAGKD